MATFEETCAAHFPHVIEEEAYVDATYRALAALGFSAENSIACVGICRDELCQSLASRVFRAWGEAYNLSSLAGMLLLGNTGFTTAHSHAPDGYERVRYVHYCMTHIGVDSSGRPGSLERIGQAEPSPTCGALQAYRDQLVAGASPSGIDRDDPELSLLREHLAQRIATGEPPSIVALTKIASTVIREDLERLVAMTVDTSKADYAVLTGVQIHGPNQTNHIYPEASYAVVRGERKELSI